MCSRSLSLGNLAAVMGAGIAAARPAVSAIAHDLQIVRFHAVAGEELVGALELGINPHCPYELVI